MNDTNGFGDMSDFSEENNNTVFYYLINSVCIVFFGLSFFVKEIPNLHYIILGCGMLSNVCLFLSGFLSSDDDECLIINDKQ